MKQEKQLLLDELRDQIASCEGFFLTSYATLNANNANKLRRELTQSNAHLEVFKKRLFVKAASELGMTFDLESLPGHVGVVIAEKDILEAMKTTLRFADAEKVQLAPLGGKVDGDVVSADEVVQLSKLPSKDVMRAQLLGLLEAPMAELVGVVDAALTSVIHCLNNKANEASVNEEG